jgi:hypothetical protein
MLSTAFFVSVSPSVRQDSRLCRFSPIQPVTGESIHSLMSAGRGIYYASL